MYVQIAEDCRMSEREYTWLRSQVGYLACSRDVSADVADMCVSIAAKLDALAAAIAVLPGGYL